MQERYLKDQSVADRYETSRRTVWTWAKNNPGFPKPVKLTGGATRWRLSDLEAWEKKASTCAANNS